ncbi:hypothetical protein [Marinimicrobium alkaliphilum]|uniref:hypothetical protein n=1 Tax=Marinimicrobium alkaliphilum TaxID=2202654 RepID=UPI00130063FE|nr:hypothetical protein [Marinimicrobium alkaliphilum]
MKPTVAASFTLFVVLSVLSVALSGAPARVHAVNIGCFFVAFVVGTVLAERRAGNLPGYVIWLLVGGVGLLLWDILSAFAVVKAEVFMGWYVLYPLGLAGLVVLQLVAVASSKLQPFNKFRQGTQ